MVIHLPGVTFQRVQQDLFTHNRATVGLRMDKEEGLAALKEGWLRACHRDNPSLNFTSMIIRADLDSSFVNLTIVTVPDVIPREIELPFGDQSQVGFAVGHILPLDLAIDIIKSKRFLLYANKLQPTLMDIHTYKMATCIAGDNSSAHLSLELRGPK